MRSTAARGLKAARLLAAATVLRRLSTGRRRRSPLMRYASSPTVSVSVVVPARNEEARIGPCLQGLAEDPDVAEVVVVDDSSSDGTAGLARRLGARVVTAGPPPPAWVGKPWALQRGLESATGEIVVSVDADTRPRPGLVRALAAALEEADFVSAGARFQCQRPGERWLHPAMLTTLVYRFGPPDGARQASPRRLLVNGQCTAVRRLALLQQGGYGPAARHLTDDAAQARALARAGWRVVFRDGSALISVDMHDSMRDLWREWGRSLALADVTAAGWLALDVAVVWLAQGLPLVRLVLGLADRLDAALLALRLALLAATARSYERRGAPYFFSPLADPAAALRLTLSALRPARRWREREYDLG